MKWFVVFFWSWSAIAWGQPSLTSDEETGLSRDREVTGGEMGQLRSYGRSVGKDVLKDATQIDLDQLARMDLTDWLPFGNSDLGAMLDDEPDGAVGGLAGRRRRRRPGMNLIVNLQQSGDPARLLYDRQDIPFSFRVSSYARLIPDILEFQTYAYLPLSYHDEIRVGSSMPVPTLNLPFFRRLMRQGGLDSTWVLDSFFTSRLGMNTLDTGLGTTVFKGWSLMYRYRYRFDDREHTTRLGIGTTF
jgi:hypothetical protein